MNNSLHWLGGLLLLHTSNLLAAENPAAILEKLKLPAGFNITLFADDVPNARSLTLGEQGIIYVGTRQAGKVYALKDNNNDGKSDQRYVLASGLNMPNGVAYKDGALYVAETNRIIRYANIANHLNNPPQPTIIYDQLPSDTHHGWKYLRFGPDNKLYTAVGAPCNICEPTKDIYTSLVRLNADGSGFEILARGIRNTVGFDWSPTSKQLFFTENGRDYLGDDLPPDELNLWTEKGQHFGYPYCHAGTIADPEFGQTQSCTKFVAPAWKFKAHIAPLGARFYTGAQFPEQYSNQLFIAQHGSWNRTEPQGYQVVSLSFKEGKPVSETPFIQGWLTQQGEVLGRPTDILQLPDGSLLISDDTLGAIYKVSYNPK